MMKIGVILASLFCCVCLFIPIVNIIFFVCIVDYVRQHPDYGTFKDFWFG